MTLFYLSLLSVFVTFSFSANGENTTLLLVQTLSRHGERGPHFLYPTDPNSPDDFPNGLGALTQIGKKQQYDVGKFFRKFYNDSITTNPKQVFANSSSQDRCLNSAQTLLSSFFAPDKEWQFTPDFDWQPIAVHYLPEEMDKYFNYPTHCPRLNESLNFHHIEEYFEQHPDMVEKISNYSGLDYSHPSNAFHLMSILETEESHNLIIPDWAKMYWDQMKYVEQTVMKSLYNSPTEIRLRVGPLLGLINQNFRDKINGKNPDLKFIVNLSHDEQIICILAAFNFTEIPRPCYSCALVFELHEMPDSSKTVRVLYMNNSYPLEDPEQPHVIVLDDCTEFCPVDQFMNSYEWLIPDNLEEECKPINSSYIEDSSEAFGSDD